MASLEPESGGGVGVLPGAADAPPAGPDPDPDPLGVLAEMARSLSAVADVEGLLDTILERSREVMRCQICSILLPDRERPGELFIRSTADGEGGPIRVPVTGSLAGEVFTRLRTLNIQDARSDPRHHRATAKRTGVEARAILTAPLADAEQGLGVVQAINPHGRPSFNDADEKVFELFASLISVTLIRLAAHRAAVRQAELQRDFELAREIQETFLPGEVEDFGDLVVESFYEPARNVGGDFYFCHQVGDGRRVLAGIGDVTGKGVAAALDMARGTTVVAAKAALVDEPGVGLGGWVASLNDDLCRVMTRGRFIAGTFLLIDREAGTLSAVTAGQFAPKLLGRQAPGWEDLRCPPNPPLGIAPGLEFAASPWVPLGRACLVFSDGLPETQDASGRYFDEAGFAGALARAAERRGDGVLAALRDAWCAFASGSSYRDDATALVVRRPPREPGQRSVELDCLPENLAEGRAFIDAWADFAGFAPIEAGRLVLGCDEVFTNIHRHAYDGGEGALRCSVEIDRAAGDFVVTVCHQGKGKDLAGGPVPCPGASETRGRGLYVIQQVFDEVRCGECESGCTVELRKRLPAASVPS